MPKRYAQLFLVACLATTTSDGWANFARRTGNCPAPAGCYELSGAITDVDALAVRTMTQDLEKRHLVTPHVRLNSPGGSVGAAMAIGRNFRKIRAIATMGEAHICHSACVFVLAGATQRAIGGSVGIHRPYSELTGLLDIEKAQSEYTRLSQASKLFLREMNLPEELYEAMVRTPPEEIRLLDRNELSAFGLNKTDPVEEDFFNSLGAQKYGLTKQEYLRRKSHTKQACNSALQSGNVNAYNDCGERVMRTGQ